MGTANTPDQKPLWLEIEDGILGLGEAEVDEANTEAAVQKIAGQLDEKGFNASRTGGILLQLRWALAARRAVGRPLKKDLDEAIGALTLENVANPHGATLTIIRKLAESWDSMKGADQIQGVGRMVEAKKLDLLITNAKTMDGDLGIRYLREQEVASASIIDGMGITQEKLDEVDAAIAAELAEIERVKGLLEGVADKSEQDQIKHLLNSDVAEALIMEIGGMDQASIDATKTAMEEEIREKERLAAEAAARKKAEAEGPSLDDIEPDDMLEHIEAIREILDFSDQEKEIRVMCEQSGIPKDLVEIAVSDPDKLDELEEKAEAEA